MSRCERFVSSLKAVVRLMKSLQVYALEFVLAIKAFADIYKFAVSITR